MPDMLREDEFCDSWHDQTEETAKDHFNQRRWSLSWLLVLQLMGQAQKVEIRWGHFTRTNETQTHVLSNDGSVQW